MVVEIDDAYSGDEDSNHSEDPADRIKTTLVREPNRCVVHIQNESSASDRLWSLARADLADRFLELKSTMTEADAADVRADAPTLSCRMWEDASGQGLLKIVKTYLMASDRVGIIVLPTLVFFLHGSGDVRFVLKGDLPLYFEKPTAIPRGRILELGDVRGRHFRIFGPHNQETDNLRRELSALHAVEGKGDEVLTQGDVFIHTTFLKSVFAQTSFMAMKSYSAIRFFSYGFQASLLEKIYVAGGFVAIDEEVLLGVDGLSVLHGVQKFLDIYQRQSFSDVSKFDFHPRTFSNAEKREE
ncbi:hypothetical protein HK101_000571 [Irineochytrium annulatum]|nr:hypothetical protein HK101_000571 [Irineochytrium annulatum]